VVRTEGIRELLLQALETELGGVQIYENAVQCAVHRELRREWERFLGQTKNHVNVVRTILVKLGIDSERETTGRQIARAIGGALVDAMIVARNSGDPRTAELVAAECVILAETNDHRNWELIEEAATGLDFPGAPVLSRAREDVAAEVEEHLSHTAGWCRELWRESLGLPARLPPPESAEKSAPAAATRHT
jgi:hypothetical protein